MLSEAGKTWLKNRGIDPDLALGLGVVSRQSRGGREELEFPRIRGAEVLGRHYRRIDVDKGDENPFRQEAGSEKMCFNENALTDDRWTGPAVLTEGEMDTLAAVQAGWDAAASVPDGAPGKAVEPDSDSEKWSYVPRLLEILGDRREVILAFDADTPGYHLRTYLQHRLGAARCLFVTYPPGCKDLNDVLRRLGREAVIRCLKAAKPVKVPGVVKFADMPPPAPETIYRAGLSEDFDKAIGIGLGHLSVWTGIPSHGKSLWMKAIGVELAKRYGIVSAFASFEESIPLHFRPAVASYLSSVPRADLSAKDYAGCDAFLDKHMVFIVEDDDDREPMTLEWLTDKMAVCAIRHGAKFFVIDPWNKIEHDYAPSEGEHRYTGRALTLLKRFARKFNVHVAVVAHPNKSVATGDKLRAPGGYDLSGSSNFFNMTDLGVTVYRDREVGNTCSKIIPWKIKRQPEMGVMIPAVLHVDQKTGRVEDWYEHGGVEP